MSIEDKALFGYIETLSNKKLAHYLSKYVEKVGPITDTTRLFYERELFHLLSNDINLTKTKACGTKKGEMISADISGMSNEDLAIALRKAGVRVGPITDTTRLVYERKLARLQQNVSETSSPAPAEVEEEEEEEEEEEKPLYEEKATERLTSAYQRYNSPLASKITGGNNTPSYIGTPARSHLNTSLTRRPLREETRFTSLRNSETSSASASASSKKKDGGISLMVKLFFLIILGLIVWLIYMNFESAATKPLLTTNH